MHGRVHVRPVRCRADGKPRPTASTIDNPRIASSLLGIDADARLEPDTIFVDQADAGHRYMKEVRRHFSDAVEGRFRRSVENLVASQRLNAPRFVFGERRFHLPMPRAPMRSSQRAAVKIFILWLAWRNQGRGMKCVLSVIATSRCASRFHAFSRR